MTTRTSAEPNVGDKMPDGTIYAGISPDTKKAMYATPSDAPTTMTFQEASDYAAGLDALGHRDWRVPTKAELNVLFTNSAAIGGFYFTGPTPPAGIGRHRNITSGMHGFGDSATDVRTISTRLVACPFVVSGEHASAPESSLKRSMVRLTARRSGSLRRDC
jgi:hypothetical protein